MNIGSQAAYWDEVADKKIFTHPLNYGWINSRLEPDAAILDLGCGYGRICASLQTAGFMNITGADISANMLKCARQKIPSCGFVQITDTGKLPFPDCSFDAVVLMAVLTTIPEDSNQEKIISEIRRILRPGGLLYASDYPLQTDDHNVTRYEKFADNFNCYGIFKTGDGGVMRHYAPERFEELFKDFELLEHCRLDTKTMNGNAAQICQWLLQR